MKIKWKLYKIYKLKKGKLNEKRKKSPIQSVKILI